MLVLTNTWNTVHWLYEHALNNKHKQQYYRDLFMLLFKDMQYLIHQVALLLLEQCQGEKQFRGSVKGVQSIWISYSVFCEVFHPIREEPTCADSASQVLFIFLQSIFNFISMQ